MPVHVHGCKVTVAAGLHALGGSQAAGRLIAGWTGVAWQGWQCTVLHEPSMAGMD